MARASEDASMRRLTVSIPEAYVSALEDVAEDLGASVSEALRQATLSYLLENYWREGLTKLVHKAILDGKSNEEALAIFSKADRVHKAISLDVVAWYRAKLRKELGQGVLTDRQAQSGH